MSQAILDAAPSAGLLRSLIDLDQAVLDALPMGVYACDAEGLILRVNRMAKDLWGRAPRLFDATQRFCGAHRVEKLTGEPIALEAMPIARALKTGERFHGLEAWVENPDGRRWVCLASIEPLRGEDGRIVGAVNCFHDVTAEHEARAAAERDRAFLQTLVVDMARQKRTFDLALVAADMGTWRYTMGDNICLYDEHAQRLYGLTDGRFLHDEAGVKRMIHPDDQAPMWAAVAAACDPEGDGRYTVRYRVKQPDGSWRWLSAWGLVEFEGEGEARRPVAIAGASRDLTETKKAEELQRLLNNELNHRVKNTLATVQSITRQTLRTAKDLNAARAAIDSRIHSLARAHDLLTRQNWSGAALSEVVARAVEPFGLARFALDGPALQVPPRYALALSMALHELATNAVKYGALSTPAGRVEVRWSVTEATLALGWRERGGPPVQPPTRRGFGSRLLEKGLVRELGGQACLDYAADGVICEITAAL